jgi:hypothetical protein
MKRTHLLQAALFAAAFYVTSCNPPEGPIAPDCPECWDTKMVCVENECQCPEDNISIWLNTYSVNEPAQGVPESGREFCIKPDKLTFIASFPKFECMDTFAIRFLTEPLEVGPQTPALATSQVEPLVHPSQKAVPPSLTLDTNDPNGLWVGITSLYPTYGPMFSGCIDYHQDTIMGGIYRISFRGNFIHKDTISGHILFDLAYGSKSALDNYQLEGIKLVRTVPY